MSDEREDLERQEDAEGHRKGKISNEPVEDDTAGHAVRPPIGHLGPTIPALEEDDAEGHGAGSGSPRPPVD
jgi:hypothetical protein